MPADPDAAISALQASFGADLLRIKGLVEISDPPGAPCVLHVVGHVASPLRRLDGWPDGVDATRIVMIVAGPGRHAAAEMLARFLPQLRAPGPGAGGRPAARARVGS
jgi:G3E family GTPase